MIFRLRALCFYSLWSAATLLFGVAGIVLLPSRRAWVALARSWNGMTLWLLRSCVGIRLAYHGREHVPQGAAIIACQHQSSIETFALWLLLDNPAFILKRELLMIPIFGWFLARLTPIAIDRSAGSNAVQRIAQLAGAQLASGRRVVIFPEGTRRPVGAPPAYKSGGLWALYSLGYPVIPAAVTTGTFWPKSGLRASGEAQMHFLPPLPQNLTKDALMQHFAQSIAAAAALLSESAA